MATEYTEKTIPSGPLSCLCDLCGFFENLFRCGFAALGNLAVAFLMTALLLVASSCSFGKSSVRPDSADGSGSVAGEDSGSARKVLIVDLGGEPKERQAVLAALKTLPDVRIEELKSGGLHERTLLFYRGQAKDEAIKILNRSKGASAVESMPWNGPYEMVIFIRSKALAPAPAKTEGPNSPKKPASVATEVVYYVTAQKYFKIVQHQIGAEGTMVMTIEKSSDVTRCFPKVTLRAMTEDRQLISEDTLKADSFLNGAVGYREDLKLSYPPGERVRNLQIEVKAYNEKGEIILN